MSEWISFFGEFGGDNNGVATREVCSVSLAPSDGERTVVGTVTRLPIRAGRLKTGEGWYCWYFVWCYDAYEQRKENKFNIINFVI